jgi:hypothetical protein
MGAMKQPRRFFILLILGAMVTAYILGTVSPPGAAKAVFSRFSISAAITPQQWSAVQASNALLLSDQSFMLYLPLSVRD